MHVSTLIASLALCAALGCGGGSTSSSPVVPPAPPVVLPPVAVARGTYQPTVKPAAALTRTALAEQVQGATIGTMPAVLAVSGASGFTLELDGWNFALGALFVAQDGTLSTDSYAYFVGPTGGSVPLVLTGTQVGNRLTGTANGVPFDLTLGTLQNQQVTADQAAGTYITQYSNLGIWVVLKVAAYFDSGNLAGLAYATLADAQAGTNWIGRFDGSLVQNTTLPQDPVSTNLFGFGIRYTPKGLDSQTSTRGMAYLDASGNLVVMSGVQYNSSVAGPQLSMQFSGLFISQ